MNTALPSLIVVFWACTSLVVYSYAGYAVLIWLLSRVVGKKPSPPVMADADLPRIDLLIAAYNEATFIDARVRNALELDYPRDRLTIVVASDGSSDATAEIVRKYEKDGVKLLDYQERRGKSAVLNTTIAGLSGEILLLSDANTFSNTFAARALTRWFADPKVVSVVGKLVLTDPVTGNNADSLYWKYETFLKTCEGRLDGLLGANGAIYAIRRPLYVPIPNNTIIDDFMIPLLAKLKHGGSIIYDVEAVAVEETPASLDAEFHRRARIGAGGFQSIGLLWPLLNPCRGWVSFTFLSHKLLRWFCPAFMIGAAVSNALIVALGGSGFYIWLMVGQIAFYLTAYLVNLAPSRLKILKPLRLTTMFTSMNAALLVGFFRWIRGTQGGAWRRTERLPKAGGSSHQ
jgi:cellulose synthase/poly-beta-1,6-N-acetylglucosamine synthase-like glycosyltransferase